MSFKDTETLSTGIEFIVEAVAVKTNGQDHSALGLYLISLLDHGFVLLLVLI